MRRRPLTAVVMALVAIGSLYLAVVGLAPAFAWRVPGTTLPIIAQFISFPAVIVASFVGGLVVAIIVLLTQWRSRGTRLIALLALALLLISTLAWARPRVIGPVKDSGTVWSVVTWNTEGELTGTALAELVAESHPDVLVLPETGAFQLDRALADPALRDVARDYGRWISRSTGETAPVSLLVRTSIGNYREVPTAAISYGSILLRAEGRPDIYAVHPAPPVPSLMGRWRSDLDTIVAQSGCRDATRRAAIVAGDLNASLHHAPLAGALHGCRDVQHEVGDRWVSTWPTGKPAWLGSTIDHVLVTRGLDPERARVVQLGTSDHRALLTQVRVGP